MQRKGYLNVVVQAVKVNLQEEEKEEPVSLVIKLGELESKSAPQLPSNWNQTYLLEVIEGVGRIAFKLIKGEDILVGECRFDIDPIISHEGSAAVVATDMMDEDGKPHAHISLKMTYNSAKHGKLAIKVKDITLSQAMGAKTKYVSARFKLGNIIKSTHTYPYPGKWEEEISLVVLSPTSNLNVEIVSEGNVIGEFAIYNIEKSGLLKEKKPIENSVYWDQKQTGKIKYEV